MRIGASQSKRNSQRGFTMIELMFAITMLAVGLVGILGLILASIGGNQSNKMDTSATMVAEMVTDMIVSQPAGANAPIPVIDCNPAGATTWQVLTQDAAAPGNGAATDTNGNIDFTQDYSSVPDGYKMRYATCGANGDQITYEVRWNILTATGYGKMVSVGARSLGAPTKATPMLFFARPVTLRTVISS